MIIKKVFYIKEVKKNVFLYKEVLFIHSLSVNQITTTKKINFFVVTINLLKF